MPRGVPASGKRQPRAASAAPYVAEESVAGSAVDWADRDAPSAEDSVAAVESSTEDVMKYPVVQLIEEAEFDPDPEPLPTTSSVTTVPTTSSVTTVPELTEEQQEIKRLRDLLARREGKAEAEPQVEELANPGDEGNILIHFLEDGLSALGKVWYRGQELEFTVGSRAYKDTFNRRGETWLDLRNDEFAQVERFGKVMFRSGPWPGKSYRDGTFEALRGDREGSKVPLPTDEEIAAAEKARKRRSAPHLPQQV